MMKRRNFLEALVATASGLLLPYEPKRVYSFARELRAPGIEEHVLGWRNFNITWDGTVARGRVDDRLVCEGVSTKPSGVFFEYDPFVPGGWRGRIIETPTDPGVHVERGHALVDWIHGTRVKEVQTAGASVRFPGATEPSGAFRLGFGWDLRKETPAPDVAKESHEEAHSRALFDGMRRGPVLFDDFS